MNKLRLLSGLGLCLALVLAMLTPSSGTFAASTTKSLSTNYTLVNLGTEDATVHVDYKLDTGATWTAPAASTDFQIAKNGGQKIVRQYQDTMTPSSGRGSVIVNASQPLGAVVQIRAIGQTATQGAYSGFSQGSNKFYVPLVSRRGTSGSGTTNSQIVVQNTGSGATDVRIQLIPATGSTGSYTKTITGLAIGTSYYYDLDDEANLATVPWYGAAVVEATTAGGQVAVVSNFFTGPNGMQTFNAFPASNVGPNWLAPLVVSRLTANNLSTPIAVQNLSGSNIAINGVTLTCTPDPALGGSPFTLKNASAAIPNNGSYFFNPVTDLTGFPGNWYGSCRISAGSANIVAFVQMRFLGTDQAAAYEAINASGTDTKAFIPLVAKRLGNGFATAVTIQNLSATTPATVTLTYTPSPDYVTAGGSATVLQTTTTIAANTSLIQNQRLAGFTVGATAMPNTWYGTLSVSSTGTPIHGFVQLTDISGLAGDTFMAHNAFTQP